MKGPYKMTISTVRIMLEIATNSVIIWFSSSALRVEIMEFTTFSDCGGTCNVHVYIYTTISSRTQV